MEIEIQLPDTPFDRIQAYAEKFNCTAHRTRVKGYYRIETDDPINFFWLGANIHNQVFNQLQPSNVSGFTEL